MPFLSAPTNAIHVLVSDRIMQTFVARFIVNTAPSLNILDFFRDHFGVANVFAPEYMSADTEIEQMILQRCLALLVKDTTKESDQTLASYLEAAVLASPLQHARWGALKSTMRKKKLLISLKAVETALSAKTQ
jgi:hypothetical protein